MLYVVVDAEAMSGRAGWWFTLWDHAVACAAAWNRGDPWRGGTPEHTRTPYGNRPIKPLAVVAESTAREPAG